MNNPICNAGELHHGRFGWDKHTISRGAADTLPLLLSDSQTSASQGVYGTLVILSEAVYVSFPYNSHVKRHIVARMLPLWRQTIAQYGHVFTKTVIVNNTTKRYHALPLQVALQHVAAWKDAAIQQVCEESAELANAIMATDATMNQADSPVLDEEDASDEMDKSLVVYSASGNYRGVQRLLDKGANAMYCDGLPFMVAAAHGCSIILKTLVCNGAWSNHPQVLQLASRIAAANGHDHDARYLAKWADMYISGRIIPNDY